MSKKIAERGNVGDLVDIETERSLLRSLIEFDTSECQNVMLKCQIDIFYQESHRKIFKTIRILDDNSVSITMETVRAEMMKRHPKSIDALMNVAITDPTPSPLHAYSVLEEWSRKRKLLSAFLGGIHSIFDGNESSLMIGNDVAKKIDETTLSTTDFTSFADLRVKYANATPLAKIDTGVSFIDARLKGGIDEGKFILLFGDQEAGKTLLATQILRNMAKNWKVLFFPFEFSARSFFDHTKSRYTGKFNENNLFVEEGSSDLFDIEAKLKLFSKQGGQLAVIDSQAMVTNNGNKGTSEERETEKFHVLSRICLRYGLRLIFICQQAKEDTRSGIVSPMKSKMGGHYAHIIFKIEMPKVKYDENGDIINFGERDFTFYKNKQTGLFGKKPIHFNLKTLEFTGKSKKKEEKPTAPASNNDDNEEWFK